VTDFRHRIADITRKLETLTYSVLCMFIPEYQIQCQRKCGYHRTTSPLSVHTC